MFKKKLFKVTKCQIFKSLRSKSLKNLFELSDSLRAIQIRHDALGGWVFGKVSRELKKNPILKTDFLRLDLGFKRHLSL